MFKHPGIPLFAVLILVGVACASKTKPDRDDLPSRAARALRNAVVFFRRDVATEGGYLWRYSADLKRREGEKVVEGPVVWVQPPGTPAVGLAFLSAYEATGEKLYVDAAGDAAKCLVRGQLRSGGWAYHIDFDPKKRLNSAYRVDPPRDGQNNWSTLDDNTSQASLRFLMRMDQVLAFKDETIHEATRFGLDSLLKVQHPNGGFSQGFDGLVDHEVRPVQKASYPDTWPRTHPQPHHHKQFYTLNDNLLHDVVDVLLDAEAIYGEQRFRDAALKVGDFLILAQMPDPQPGWAQQYDFEMHPAWARRFEPPAITGGESQGAMRTLLKLYRATGQRRFLEPLQRALEYYQRSRLPDGKLARFYELRTNRPLYFTLDYALTYSDEKMPTHYRFQVESGLDPIERIYDRLRKMSAEKLEAARTPKPPKLTNGLINRTRKAVSALDKKGRWIEPGGLRYDKKYRGPVINCRTFIGNVETLSQYLAAVRAAKTGAGDPPMNAGRILSADERR